jgi:hypothetical protein
MRHPSRAQFVSSFTIVKGALLDETSAAFQHGDLEKTKAANLEQFRSTNAIGLAARTDCARETSP